MIHDETVVRELMAAVSSLMAAVELSFESSTTLLGGKIGRAARV